ncbi:acyl-CoA dehydrogenase family protein [Streptomyces eurythermus]|uniref:acyl-CoA dehydrogenase family protein n=1 Tax=Streptomyces eurythermus TaxID=42237 RepID=UPI00340EF8D4
MHFTLGSDLVALREHALKTFRDAAPSAEHSLYDDLWAAAPVPDDDSLLRAALIAEAAGASCGPFHPGERIALAWIAARHPGLRPVLESAPHVLAAVCQGTDGALEIRRGAGTFAVDGTFRVLAPDTATAGHALVLAAHRRRRFLVSVPLAGRGVRVTASRTVQPDRRLLTVTLDQVGVPEHQALSWDAERALVSLGQVLAAAELLGVMQWTLDACVDRARSREQFGRPIGAFQSVAHTCADMLCAVELSRSMVYAAAARHDGSGAPEAHTAAVTRILLRHESLPVLTEAVQLFGADGLRWSGDLHRQLRRCQVLRSLWGTPASTTDDVIEYLRGQVAAAAAE